MKTLKLKRGKSQNKIRRLILKMMASVKHSHRHDKLGYLLQKLCHRDPGEQLGSQPINSLPEVKLVQPLLNNESPDEYLSNNTITEPALPLEPIRREEEAGQVQIESGFPALDIIAEDIVKIPPEYTNDLPVISLVELVPDELPISFSPDEKVANQNGMKLDVVAKLAEEVSSSIEKTDPVHDDIEDATQVQVDSTVRKVQPSFPLRPVANPDRRKEQIIMQISDAPKKQYEMRFRSVRASSPATDAKTWLRNQYTNESDQMICQICKDVMPFRNRNGLHHFEAVEVLTELHIDIEHVATHLALCPLCAARYEEFIKDDNDSMADLKKNLAGANNFEVPLKLGDLNTSLRFVETHFHDLRTIIDVEQQKPT